MGKIEQKLNTFLEALETLKEGIGLFREYQSLVSKNASQKNEQLFVAVRDSIIQRFEYCTDLFWKLLKTYLEEVEKVEVTTNSPRGIVRTAVQVKIISEDEGKDSIVMVTSRNQTSRIYHEETAEDIAKKVPTFYELMKVVSDRLYKKGMNSATKQ